MLVAKNSEQILYSLQGIGFMPLIDYRWPFLQSVLSMKYTIFLRYPLTSSMK